MSANGLYDPDISGTGHQPRGFDQLMAMFDHYVVTNAEIRLIGVTNAPSLTPATAHVGICVRDSATTETTPYEYIEQGWNRWTISSSTAGVDLCHKVDILKFLGRSNALADPYLKGSASANPTEDVNFHVWVANPYSADTTVHYLYCRVEIVYDTWFIEPKDPGVS
jgi:hypothetical protein